MSPTKIDTAAEWPPTNCVDRVAIASNTGCKSDGEEAITLRTSAVGLPFQGFLGLVEQARVLDGDHLLVGKRLDQLDLSLAKWFYTPPRQGERTYHHAITQQRYPQCRPGLSYRQGYSRPRVLGIGSQVGNVHGLAFERCASGDGAAAGDEG